MVKRYFTSLASSADDPSPFERPPKRYFTSVVSSADDPSPFKTPPKQPKRYFTSVVSSNDYASSSQSPFKRPPKQPTLQTRILHPNHATIFHQNSKRILHLNQTNIRRQNQTVVSDEDSSSESDDKIFKPRVKAAAEEENRNPNVKTPNNNEPADKKSPTLTIPEPIPLIDSSLMAAAITADVKEYRESYVLEMDMAGLKSSEIKVEMEDENVLVISGERKREEGVKYLRMERRVGNLLRKFVLPENANTYTDAISAVFQDGLLSVTVQKKFPSPQPNITRRTIQVVRIA